MTDLFPNIELDLSRYLRSQSKSQTKPKSKPTLLPRLAGERQPFIPRKAPPIKEPLRRGPDSVSFTTQQLIDEHRRRERSALAALQSERHFQRYYQRFLQSILGA